MMATALCASAEHLQLQTRSQKNLVPGLTHDSPVSLHFQQILTTFDSADRCALLAVWKWQSSQMTLCPRDVRSQENILLFSLL